MPEPKDPYPTGEVPRGLGLQVAIAVTMGLSAILIFSMWRRKWPRLYAARTFRRRDLPPLPSNMFGWMGTLYRTTDKQVLEYAGLDAYVFLMFFQAAYSMLLQLTLISFVAIGPIRWYYTGRYDEDDDPKDPKAAAAARLVGYMAQMVFTGQSKDGAVDDSDSPDSVFGNFLWVYPIFTIIFTLLCLRCLRKYTLKVVKVRQEYLGSQNSITDRTIRLTGVPKSMRTKQALTEYFANLRIGEAQTVVLCHNWENLDKLFSKRNKIIHQLERYWADYLGPTFINEIDMENITLPTVQLANPISVGLGPGSGSGSGPGAGAGNVYVRSSTSSVAFPQNVRLVRPYTRSGLLGLWGEKVDLIEKYSRELQAIDAQISHERNRTDRKVTHTAFITMESVHACQMAAQALLNPVPHSFLTHLAPAPHDVVWKNIYLGALKRSCRQYTVTAVFLLSTVLMTVPFFYLSRFIDIKIIKNYFPWLAKWLEENPWLETFVTQVLTTYIFTLLNILTPYFNAYLSERQGYISREDVELSTLSKNFFYVFLNLFLVFTIGTNINKPVSIPSDSTKFATMLAQSLRRLSAFYTNLIVLQGLGLLPVRLLQAGSLLQFPLFMAHCKSAREYHDLYKPASLNYGILLPTSLLVFLLALMYSILSGRIVFFGAVYFLVGYYVYKYQVLYSMVHAQHSTGRLWTLIIRRACFGLMLFQLAMFGILLLQTKSSLMPLLLLPMPFIVAAYWYDFEKFVEPLLRVIAIDAVTVDDASGSGTGSSSLGAGGGHYYSDSDEEFDPHTSINTLSHIPRVQSANLSQSYHSDGETVEPSSFQRRKLTRPQSRTLDEEREQHLQYVNPNLVSPLDGPWIGVEGNECVIANPTGLVRRQMPFDEWE